MPNKDALSFGNRICSTLLTKSRPGAYAGMSARTGAQKINAAKMMISLMQHFHNVKLLFRQLIVCFESLLIGRNNSVFSQNVQQLSDSAESV